MTECPNFFRGKKNMFKTDMKVFVIDQNGYDLRKGVIKCFANNAWTIFYPDTKEVEDIIDSNRVIPYNKDNKAIFKEQKIKRKEISEMKDSILSNPSIQDTKTQDISRNTDLPPKKPYDISDLLNLTHPPVNLNKKPIENTTHKSDYVKEPEVVDVKHEIDKSPPKYSTEASSPNESDVEVQKLSRKDVRTVNINSLQPTSIEFNTNLSKTTTTWTFKITF